MLLGRSNSGKSKLSEMLTSVWTQDERGIFNSPAAKLANSFIMQDLVKKDVATCDELTLENITFVEQIKLLTEGSKAMNTDVKFGGNVILERRPSVFCSNSANMYDLTTFCQNARETLANRMFVLKMNVQMENRFNLKALDYLLDNSQMLMKKMYIDYYIDTVQTVNMNELDFNVNIDELMQ